MIIQDWLCRECGYLMAKTQNKIYLVCFNMKCKSKLQEAKQLMDLPVATRLRRHYVLAGLYEVAFDEEGDPLKGWWTLVPHKHKHALNQCPDPGHVVVRVWNVRYKKWYSRTLRQIHPRVESSPKHVSS